MAGEISFTLDAGLQKGFGWINTRNETWINTELFQTSSLTYPNELSIHCKGKFAVRAKYHLWLTEFFGQSYRFWSRSSTLDRLDLDHDNHNRNRIGIESIESRREPAKPQTQNRKLVPHSVHKLASYNQTKKANSNLKRRNHSKQYVPGNKQQHWVRKPKLSSTSPVHHSKQHYSSQDITLLPSYISFKPQYPAHTIPRTITLETEVRNCFRLGARTQGRILDQTLGHSSKTSSATIRLETECSKARNRPPPRRSHLCKSSLGTFCEVSFRRWGNSRVSPAQDFKRPFGLHVAWLSADKPSSPQKHLVLSPWNLWLALCSWWKRLVPNTQGSRAKLALTLRWAKLSQVVLRELSFML